jgi:hypothetical protein
MDSRKETKANSNSSGRAAGALLRDLTGDSPRKREALRRRYRPDKIRILFIGEAPPRSGRFFYRGDSGLYRAVRDTFLAAFPALIENNFLKSFQASGCYLVDLCGQPVDHLLPNVRAAICSKGEGRLEHEIRRLRPKVVVTVVRSIRASVERALTNAGWSGLQLQLPYPGRWKHHRVEFQRRLVPLLTKTLPLPSREKDMDSRS